MSSDINHPDLKRLQTMPVLRTTQQIVFNRYARQWVSRGLLFTVVGEPRPHVIDEDDPSIYGHQLLGREGQRAWLVTVQVRGEAKK